MTTLIFVRHGQSVSNLERRFTGQGDTPLTELGLLQAQCTADFLKDRHIDQIYASDLLRAMQTAEPTARMHGLEITPNASFREINAGKWEGMIYDDILKQFPESFLRWKNDVGHAQPDGGEAVLDLAKRVYAETQRILCADRGKTVAIFTHATPLRMMGSLWHGIAPEDASKVPFCGNASVSIVEYEDDGRFRVVLYGYYRHQGENATYLPQKDV